MENVETLQALSQKLLDKLKGVVTELLRDPSDLPPQRVPSDCGATGGKASPDAQTEGGNTRETSKVAGGAAGGEDLDAGADWDPISTEATQEGGRVARERTDDSSGTPEWGFGFMQREGLSVRTGAKLAPKLAAAHDSQVLEFSSHVFHL